MALISVASSWYTAGNSAQLDIAQTAFDDAVRAFHAELSAEERQANLIEDGGANHMESLLQAVCDAQKRYQDRKSGSKVQEALYGLAEKIHYYSGMMDVFVSHHPEYTALVWGAMKVLFVGVTNHQKLLCRLSEGLADIAVLLPRTQLLMHLYPTPQIYQIAAGIYAYIVRFLIRALGWYKESKVKHALHAITRPVELRYDDILAKIAALSRNLTELALAGSHAEQRDMHISLRQQLQGQQALQKSLEQLASQVFQIQTSLTADRALKDCARIRSEQSLSDVQLEQFIDYIRVPRLLEPYEMLQSSVFRTQKRLPQRSQAGQPFWLDDKIQRWNRAPESTFVTIAGTWKMRSHLQNFCALSVKALEESHVPTLWALQTIAPDRTATDKASTIDLIKYLVVQAVKLNKNIHTDAALAPYLQSCRDAGTEQDWIKVLASAMDGLPLLYVILDLEVLDSTSTHDRVVGSWPRLCRKVFGLLRERGVTTVLRIAMVTYGSSTETKLMMKESPDSTIILGRIRQERLIQGRPQRDNLGVAELRSSQGLDLARLSRDIPIRTRKGRGLRMR